MADQIRRLGELHLQAARKKALYLHGCATAAYPEEWSKFLVDQISLSLTEFSFHAYRVNELSRIDCDTISSVSALPYKISANDPGEWEHNYRYALNLIRHAKSFIFGWINLGHRTLFENSDANLSASYVRIVTDQDHSGTVSIFGLAFSFLNEVIPSVKSAAPDWQF